MLSLPTNLLAFIWHFIRKRPWSFAIYILSPGLLVLETNVMPYGIKMVIDGLTSFTGDRNDILPVILPGIKLYLFAFLTLVTLIRLQNWVVAYLLPKFESDIRMSLVQYVVHHSYQYFANNLSGNLANKIGDIPRALETIITIFCWNIVPSTLTAIVTIYLLAQMSLISAAFVALWVVVHLAITMYFAIKINAKSAINAEDKSILSGTIVDVISNILSLKLFARKSHELAYIYDKQQKEANSYLQLNLKFNHMRFWMDATAVIMMLGLFYGIVYGWKKGNLTAGEVSYIIFGTNGLMYQLWFLAHAMSDFFKNIGTAKQALNIVVADYDIIDNDDAKSLSVTKGEIKFEDVTFYYKQHKNVFEKVNLTIEAGSKVGLVGFSGAGKTSFVNLLLRFYNINSGRILIDDQNIFDVTQDSLRSQLAIIPQDTSLFHRTIMENIRFGKPSASDEEVIEASKLACCHEFITALPEGYNSLVGERGVKLSGGQRQRIAIARAMLKKAPILILDEATSALDSVTEKYIQEALHNIMIGRTTIVVAHRLSTLAEMDRILVFDDGKIIEDGTHSELISQNGHYATMWKMQAGGFLPNKKENTEL